MKTYLDKDNTFSKIIQDKDRVFLRKVGTDKGLNKKEKIQFLSLYSTNMRSSKPGMPVYLPGQPQQNFHYTNKGMC